MTEACVSAEFNVEYGLQRNMLVILTTETKDDVVNFQLEDPSGQLFNVSEKVAGQRYFSFPAISDVGIWTYRVKMNQTQKRISNFTVEILAEISSENGIKATHLRMQESYSQVGYY